MVMGVVAVVGGWVVVGGGGGGVGVGVVGCVCGWGVCVMQVCGTPHQTRRELLNVGLQVLHAHAGTLKHRPHLLQGAEGRGQRWGCVGNRGGGGS